MTSPKKEVAPAKLSRGDHEDLTADKGGSYPVPPAPNSPPPREGTAPLPVVQKTGDWPDAMIPTPDFAEALRHCNQVFSADDAVLLVALDPDGKARPEATVQPRGNRDVHIAAWLQRMTKLRRNLYFQPNPVRDIQAVFARVQGKPAPMKATLTNTLEARWLTLDIDPRAGEDHDEEQARILALLMKAEPEPALIVNSGNGLQALYRLQDPIVLPLGTEEEARDAGLYNLALAQQYGGDTACQDLARLMRLAGTINWPNKKKRQQGRVPRLAQLVAVNDIAHSLDAFQKASAERPAPAERARDSKGLAATAAAITPQQITSLDELPDTVPETVRRIIQHGDNPDDPSQFAGDRSKAVWHVVCELMRQRVAEEVILFVITNPAFGISAHVLEQPRSEKYALRQLAQARKEVGMVLPMLQLPQGARQHRELAADLAALLRSAGNYFNRGGFMARLSPQHRFVTVKKADAVTHFERVAMFGKRNDKHVLRPSPLILPVAEVVLRAEELIHGLPELEAVVDCPVLLDAGSQLRLVSGYSEPEKLFAHGPAPVEVPFEEAKAAMLDLLCDFQFVSPGDRSRAVAALYSPALVFGRFLGTERAPEVVMEGDESQAGKSFFCKLVASIYRTRPCVIARKLTGNGVGSLGESVARALIAGEVFLMLDNIRGKRDEPFIEAAQTLAVVACRALHQEAMVDVTRIVWMMTSNQAELTPDQAKRCTFVRIIKQRDGYVWKLWDGRRLQQHVAHNQPYLLGCVHALLREWHRRGKPVTAGAGHDFHVWASVVRYINIEMLGLADPIDELRSIQARVRSPMENWARAIVLAIAKARHRLGDTLRASDLLDICVEEGVPVPGWREEEDNSTEARRVVALQMIGRFLAKVFSAARSDFRVDGWLMRRGAIAAPSPNDPKKKAFVYRVDSDTASPPLWAPAMSQGSLPFGGEPSADAPLSPPSPPCS